MDKTNSYYAFISYSRKDIKDAKWIHSSLERFHIPTKLPRPAGAEPIPRPLRCFRDINDLDVMPESFVKGIENALASSKYLIVVCSPNSARSTADGNHYVDCEIQQFIKINGEDYAKNHILPVIIDGEISHNTKENECLPPSLYNLGEDFLTHNFPILDYGDDKILTNEAKNDFILKILAFLLQVKYSVLNDRYQKAQRKRRNIVLAAAVSLVAVFAVISLYAVFGWRKANKNLAFAHYVQANSYMKSGDHFAQTGNPSYALAYYKKSLQLDNNPVVRNKVYTLITENSWLVEKDNVSDKEINGLSFEEQADIYKKFNVGDKNFGTRLLNIMGLVEDGAAISGVWLDVSRNKKYVSILSSNGDFEIGDIPSGKIIYRDSPQNGYSWSPGSFSLISDDGNFIVYWQKKNSENAQGFMLKCLELSSMSVTTLVKPQSLSAWNISSDGQFFVYAALISNNESELVSYDLKKKQIKWKKREKKPRTKIVFSPDNIHFASTGSIFIGDESSHGLSVYNCFDKDETVSANVNGTVQKMKFSNDGRRIAVSSSNNELYIFNTRDGSPAVLPRRFDVKILNMFFTDDDNSIQVKFQGGDGTECKEYAICVNKLNFDIVTSDVKPGIIYKTLSINEKYLCLLCASSNGFFLEIKNVTDSDDFFILPLQEDINDFSNVNFIKQSKSGEFLFVGIGNTSKDLKGAIDVYRLDFSKNDYLSYSHRINTPYSAHDMSQISENKAIVFCSTIETEVKDNVCMIDFTKSELDCSVFAVGTCVAYGIGRNNEMYTITENTNKEDHVTKSFIKKWNIEKQSEQWSREIKSSLGYDDMFRYNISTDRNGNAYVVTNSNTVSIFNPSGKIIKKLDFKNRIVSVVLNKLGTMIAVGTSPMPIGKDVWETEVHRIKDNSVVFKTDYQSENVVCINKFAFSDDSSVLYIAGKYQSKRDLGFYDVWDLTASNKINENFDFEISEVKDFELYNSGAIFLYTFNFPIVKSLPYMHEKLSKELTGNALYQLLGGWTLNSYDVVECISVDGETHGTLYQWMVSDLNTKTVNPVSSTKISDALPFFNTSSNHEVILDIDPCNAQALDSYAFGVSENILEKNFKKDKTINSWNDEKEISIAWENEFTSNFWRMLAVDEEALKLFKFYIDNYTKKAPDSEKPLKYLRDFYKLVGDEKNAQKIYNKMITQYSETVFMKLHVLDTMNSSFTDKVKSFTEMLSQEREYTYEEIKDLFVFFKNKLAMDLSFDEIKNTVDWFVSKFKQDLIETAFANSKYILGLFQDIAYVVQFHEGGFNYILKCIDYMFDGLSDTYKSLLKLDDLKLYSRMMNDIVKSDSKDMEKLINDTHYSSLNETAYFAFMQNVYMYYAMTKNSKKDALLEQLLAVDKGMSLESMSTSILTDLRLYKRLGLTNVIPNTDFEKVFSLAYNLMMTRLKNGNAVGLTISYVSPDGQAARAGVQKGDTLLFYDKYPVSASIRDFFMYDLHTSEQKEQKESVEVIVLHNGNIRRITVHEGLLGVAF